MNVFWHRLELILKRIMLTTVVLLIRAFEMIVRPVIKQLPFVELVAIIRMVLLSAKLRTLLLELGRCFCMPNECFRNIFLRFFGRLLLSVVRIK
jgi:hypothetical protein